MNRDVKVALQWSLHGLNMLTTSLQPVLSETANSRDYEKLQMLLDYMRQLKSLQHNLSQEWKEQLDGLSGEAHFTHISKYYMPVLQALYDLGGTAYINDVLQRVECSMKSILTPVDYELLNKGVGLARWSNHARWARYNLMKSGYILQTRQLGVWEISEKGRQAVLDGISLEE